MINGIAQQKLVKEVLRDRSLKIVDDLRDKTAEKIKTMSGSGCKRKKVKKLKGIKRRSGQQQNRITRNYVYWIYSLKMSFTECMKSELDLFAQQPLQTNILKTEEVPYKPLTSLEIHLQLNMPAWGMVMHILIYHLYCSDSNFKY